MELDVADREELLQQHGRHPGMYILTCIYACLLAHLLTLFVELPIYLPTYLRTYLGRDGVGGVAAQLMEHGGRVFADGRVALPYFMCHVRGIRVKACVFLNHVKDIKFESVCSIPVLIR